jgi:hypothetical protein
MDQSEIDKNVIANKGKCFKANGGNEYCNKHCILNAIPCKMLEEILIRG